MGMVFVFDSTGRYEQKAQKHTRLGGDISARKSKRV